MSTTAAAAVSATAAAVSTTPLLPVARPPRGFWDHDAAAMTESAADWLWPGFIARGNVTLLTSLWKAGKTTLLAHLLARRAAGQTLAGLPVSPGKTVVISEEPRPLWVDRCRQFPFGGTVHVFAQPFPHLPALTEWQELLAHIGTLRAEHNIDLLIVDSLTHFLRSENDKRGILDLLMPVRALTAAGMAAVLTHHPRRHGAGLGIAGRGHDALHAEIDISIEMRHAAGNLDSRARRFFCLSRHAATPRHFAFELNADGTDYTVLPQPEDDGFNEQWHVLRQVLEDAEQKLTRLDVLDEWPDDFPKPAPKTLWTWLKRAAADKLIEVEGTGRKNDPLRYWLTATEERWRKEHPFYDHFERQRRELKLPYRSLREHKRAEAGEREEPITARNIWPPGAPLE
jgi:hypothetical protein